MLSTRPEKSVGTDAIWELATEGLKGALDRKGWAYTVIATTILLSLNTINTSFIVVALRSTSIVL